MHQPLWTSVKWISLSVSVGSVLLAVVLVWIAGPTEVEVKAVETTEQPQTAVESPVVVERKDGEVVWQLKASEARQQQDGQMLLISPLLTLYTDRGEEITIIGEQAWFEPLKRNIRFQNRVNVDYQVWKMQTETLIYESQRDEIHVPENFSIKGKTISAKGKDMRLHRASDTIKIDDGIWIQDSDPKWQGVNQ